MLLSFTYQLQEHWDNMLEIVKSMEKVAKDANKVYDQVCSSTDGHSGPSKTKCRLLAELEDVHHKTFFVSVRSEFLRIIGCHLDYILRLLVFVCAAVCS
jgi:hypothetical protein